MLRIVLYKLKPTLLTQSLLFFVRNVVPGKTGMMFLGTYILFVLKETSFLRYEKRCRLTALSSSLFIIATRQLKTSIFFRSRKL